MTQLRRARGRRQFAAAAAAAPLAALAVLAVLGAWPAIAIAQPAPAPPPPDAPLDAPDAGYIGREVTPLEVDDCKPTELTKTEAEKQGYEHYARGEILYTQGDYQGAVLELVYGYCLVPSYYTLLKDIGQAYERDLDYEKAIGYLERYVRQVPTDARPAQPGALDPQQDKANVARRVEVLKTLKAKLYVETQPAGARITIANDAGVAARARAGETIELLGGHYEMTTELDGFEPHRQSIDVKIGKPYTYFVPLVARKGRLSMQVAPADARIFIGDRLVGIGHIDVALPGDSYVVTTEAPDRITDHRSVVVLANQVNRVQIELAAQPQLGRRQLIAFTTGAGAAATAAMLSSFHNLPLSLSGAAAGGAAGFVGTAFLLPDDLRLGTSNLAVTATLGGGVFGAGLGLVFSQRPEVVQPLAGAGAVLGGAFGYYMGRLTRISTGDAALINSGVVWGSVAGGLFALSFDPGHTVGGGLVLSGLGMGAIGGVLLQHSYGITRTHAVLIDVGGLIGIIGGLAAESLAYPNPMTTAADAVGGHSQEHIANFALGGMVTGLLAASVLTRDIDSPAIPVAPSVTQAVGGDGHSIPIYGLTGSW